MDLQILEAVAAIVQALGVVIGFVFAVRQIGLGVEQLAADKRNQQAQTLLLFDQMLDRHDCVHKKLRPGGAWADGETALSTEDWGDIERYMGLFERAKVLLDAGLLKLDEFDQLFGYRVRNISGNPIIQREKLQKRAYGWTYFLQLESLLAQAQGQRAKA